MIRSIPWTIRSAALGPLLALAVASVAEIPPAQGQSEVPWAGTVTVLEGDASLTRGETAYRVVRGAGIQLGDSFEMKPGGTLVLALENGPVITLAERTVATIDRRFGGWQVDLLAGEVRCVHDGATACIILARHGKVEMGRGIARMQADRGITGVNLEAGAASLLVADQRFPLTQSELLVVDRDGSVHVAGAVEQGRVGEHIRLAAAIQTAPQLQPPDPPVGPVTPDPFNSELGGLDPPATESGDSTDAADDQPPRFDEEEDELPRLLEEDDDLPRFAQDPAAEAAPGEGDVSDDDSLRTIGTFAGSPSLSLGSPFGASGIFSAGGANNDANQQTFQGMDQRPATFGQPFPGAIHLVTAQQRYAFSQVQLNMAEVNQIFGGASALKYFSIGEGAPPTGQVLTNFFTGTGATPNVIDVPRFNTYLLELDQFNYPDPTNGGTTNVAITGLTGDMPTSPTVIGATPLEDGRANINSRATFALGEFLVKSINGNNIEFSIRRSDQDRKIVKDPGGNDALDEVTPNDDVTFVDVVDPRFLPQSPTVKEPDPANALNPRGTRFGELQIGRRAAFTTLMADQLHDYARRTGQTRFVLDGKIVDISGYRPAP